MSRKGPPTTQAQPVEARRKYKLDAQAVEAMRARHAQGESRRSLAASFGVDRKTVQHWVNDTNYLPLPWVRREVAHA